MNAPSSILSGGAPVPDIGAGAVRLTPPPLDLGGATEPVTRLDIFHGYMGVFVIAFLVTLIATPIMRRLAIANGVIDRPNDPRKQHTIPVAYLGGVAVYLGMLAGIAYSYFAQRLPIPLIESHALGQEAVPFSVLLGMTLIMFAGLLDDVIGVRPRVKVSMQLIAAAALALQDVGVKVAAGLLAPLGRLVGNETLVYMVRLPFLSESVPVDLIYWAGTAIIAIFILGACNASNLIDGLDGLCSGVTAVAACGLLVIALTLAVANDGKLDSARIVLCLCLLGGCLGFLPHNFNPATIFLGDSGSLLLGFSVIVIVLTLGDTGRTALVVAGLLIYLLPIIDTTLAIVRRKLAGKPMSAADDQHLHHQLKRALGVKGAVFVMYGIAGVFATLGVVVSYGRARVAYAIALVLASYIGVTAVKIARQRQIEAEALAKATPPPPPPPPPSARARPGPAPVPTRAAAGAAEERDPRPA